MRTIYLGLSRSKGKLKVGSLLIRWSELYHNFLEPKGWFDLYHSSHVFALHPPHALRPFEMVNHSAGSMVHWLSGPNFRKINHIVSLYKFNVNVDQYHKIKNKADLQCGDKYPFMENVGIVWVRLLYWAFKAAINNPFGTGAKMQKCSELILRNIILEFESFDDIRQGVFNMFGVMLSRDLDNIGVRDMQFIFDYCETKGYCQKVEGVQIV